MNTLIKSLKVDARLISHLGEALIDSNKVALMELIKNSSDADATVCKIDINTDFENDKGKGKILIEDNGIGMNSYIIENSFLKIASSFKKNFQKISPKFKRIAQGNKGIGRLSLNKLGTSVKITTKLDTDFLSENYKLLDVENIYGDNIDNILKNNQCKYYTFEINWEQFDSENTSIEDVKISIKHENMNDSINFNRKKHGTKIEIFGLKNIEYWNDNTVIESIKEEITQLFNPFIEKESSFLVKVKISNNPIFTNDTLDKERIKQTAFSYTAFNFLENEKKLNIHLRRNKHYIKSEVENLINEMNKSNFKVIKKPDYNYLYKKYSEDIVEINLSNLQELKNTVGNYQCELSGFNLYDEDKIFLPGNFNGEIFAYSFANNKEITELKKYINEFLGVKVYRNNFRILPYGSIDNDWLDMSGYNSRIKSIIYKKHTTIGYVKIDGLENLEKIKEMTNRQGIQLDNYGQNFILLMKNIVYRIIAKLETNFNNVFSTPPKQVLRKLNSGEEIKSGELLFKKNEDFQKDSKELINKMKDEVKNEPKNDVISEILESLDEKIDEIDKYNLNKERLIDQEYIEIKELTPILGSAIIAQSLAHEIKRLSNQIDSIIRTIKHYCDVKVHHKLDQITMNCYYLSKYASVLDVNSKAKRRKYETFLIKDYLETLLEENPILHYKGEDYKCKIKGKDFTIRGIKANIKVIVENMILNSLYWLEYFNIPEPLICFELFPDERKLIISDNGKGIDQNISNKIFEPFVSNKPYRDGLGMGLYIVTELLQDFGAIISLDEELNRYGNKYKFIIEFLEVNNNG